MSRFTSRSMEAKKPRPSDHGCAPALHSDTQRPARPTANETNSGISWICEEPPPSMSLDVTAKPITGFGHYSPGQSPHRRPVSPTRAGNARSRRRSMRPPFACRWSPQRPWPALGSPSGPLGLGHRDDGSSSRRTAIETGRAIAAARARRRRQRGSRPVMATLLGPADRFARGYQQ